MPEPITYITTPLGSDDCKLFTQVWNQGIDARLEAFTERVDGDTGFWKNGVLDRVWRGHTTIDQGGAALGLDVSSESALAAVGAVALLGGCADGFDGDFRSIGNGFDTTEAVQAGVAPHQVLLQFESCVVGTESDRRHGSRV